MTTAVAGSVCCCDSVPQVICNACGQSGVSVPSAVAATVTWGGPGSNMVGFVSFSYACDFSIGPQNRCRWVSLGTQIKTIPNTNGTHYFEIRMEGVTITATPNPGASWASASSTFDYAQIRLFNNDGTYAGVTQIISVFGGKACAGPVSPIGTYGTAGVGPWTVVS